jgi:serine/threonine protein kinase
MKLTNHAEISFTDARASKHFYFRLWYKNVNSKHMEAIVMELGESDLLVYVQNSFKREDLLDKELIPILEQVLLGLKALHDKG